jgi:transposase
MFVRPVLTMDQRAWTGCHVEAFAFFGGVPARLVPDNLKTGVDKPDLVLAENLIPTAHAACWYSWSTPPSRSRRRIWWPAIWSEATSGTGSGWSGRAFAMP